MSLEVRCPKCRAHLAFSPELTGRTVGCGHCGQFFELVADTAAPPEVPEAKEKSARKSARRSADRPSSDCQSPKPRRKPDLDQPHDRPTRHSGDPERESYDDRHDDPEGRKNGGSVIFWILLGTIAGLMVIGLAAAGFYFMTAARPSVPSTSKVTNPTGPADTGDSGGTNPVPRVPGQPLPGPKNKDPDDPRPPMNDPPIIHPDDPRPPVRKVDPQPIAKDPVFPQPVPKVFPAGRSKVPVVIEPPTYLIPFFANDPQEKGLPGTVDDACLGGAGRFIFLRIPTLKQLAVFDVTELRVTRTVPLLEEKALFAASRNHLVVYYPSAKVLHRHSLPTMLLEGQGPAPVKASPKQLVMGHLSFGPLLMSLGTVEFGRNAHAVMFDVDTLRTIPFRTEVGKGNATLGDGQVRISGDGRIATNWRPGVDSSTGEVFRLRSDHVLAQTNRSIRGPMVLGDDGRMLFTSAGVTTLDGEVIRAGEDGRTIPAVHGDYYLRWQPNRDSLPGTLTLHRIDQPKALSLLASGKLSLDGSAGDRESEGALPLDRRLFYYPGSGVLVGIPASRDRLVVSRIDLHAALRTASPSPPILLSRPATAVRRSETFKFSLSAKAGDSGQVFARLENGPSGMAIKTGAVIEWTVPKDFLFPNTAEYTVVIDDGQSVEMRHSFKIAVRE